MELYVFKISLNKTKEMFYISQNIYCIPLTENNTIKAVGNSDMKFFFACKVSISKSTIT